MSIATSPLIADGAPSQPTLHRWRLSADEIRRNRRHVQINAEAIDAILPWLQPGPPNEAWRGYVSAVDPVKPDIERLFFELALTISQFGGFVGHREDGSVEMWKLQGSGIKAILRTMEAIRNAGKLPGLDITSDFDRELAHYFLRVPFGQQRLDMLKEVAAPSSRAFFSDLLKTSRQGDGCYRFDALHMVSLACRFPQAFGEDPYFFKKASLLLMTVEIALNQLGFKAVAATMPPADYRIPQILEGLGILTYSKAFAKRVVRGEVFRLSDPPVHAVRAATVEAVALIKQRYERHIGKGVSCAELDGLLYLLSRNEKLMTKASMKPHMLVATPAF